MMKSVLSLLKSSRSHSHSQSFQDFYLEWIQTLETTLLPLLTHSLSAPSPDPLLLATHVNVLHTHFRSYFSALDLASSHNISFLLYPNFRNPLEKPFLWFADFHPYIFTHLLRSFLDDDNQINSEMDFLGKPCNVVLAWKNLDNSLGHKVEQMECTLRLMVPSIVARARDAQALLVGKLGVGWCKEGGSFKVDDVVGEVVDELTCAFLDANRLRRSVLADILGSLNVYQAALFLEGLAKFYVGFRDSKLLGLFNKSKLSFD